MRHRSTSRRAGALLSMVAAALLVGTGFAPPAVAATDVVHGVVTDRGHAVAGVRVGYTNVGTAKATPSGLSIGTTATARTDSRGRFTIHLPAAPGTGFVWAGLQPTEQHALFTASGTSFVRAVVGAAKPKGAPSALFQTQHAAKPSAIAGGGSIAIRLQRSARLAGTDRALRGSKIVLHRGDGSIVETVAVSASGRYRSPALAPGRYPARLILPGASAPTRIADVVLRSGGTASIAAGAAARVRHRQSVVTGKVVSPKGVAKRRVRVEARQDGRLVAVARSTTAGKYVFRGLAAGTYTLLAGRNAPDLYREPSLVHLTPDDTVSVSRTVVVHAAATTRRALPLGRAGRITGTTTAHRLVLIEDATGRLVRTARTDPAGGFAAGGLPTGDYTVISPSGSHYGSAEAHVTAGKTTAVGDVQPTTPLLTAHGTVRIVPLAPGELVRLVPELDGAVLGYDTQFAWQTGSSAPDAAGAWTSGSLVPGRYTFGAGASLSSDVPADGLAHSDGPPVTRKVTAATEDDPIALDLGPRNGLLAGTFRSTGGPGIGYFPFGVTAPRGASQDFFVTAAGDFQLTAAPGRYGWTRGTSDTAVAADGPWWAAPTHRSLTVPAGVRRDVIVPLTFHR